MQIWQHAVVIDKRMYVHAHIHTYFMYDIRMIIYTVHMYSICEHTSMDIHCILYVPIDSLEACGPKKCNKLYRSIYNR